MESRCNHGSIVFEKNSCEKREKQTVHGLTGYRGQIWLMKCKQMFHARQSFCVTEALRTLSYRPR